MLGLVLRMLGPVLLMLLVASQASAEVRRLEVVGVVPGGADARSGVSVRQAALGAALAQAVDRVARERLSPDAAADPDLDLGRLLGGKPRDFTVGYKVLEDRGERRALLLTDPEISTEYVLLAEVFVDVTRVESALDAAGLPLREPLQGSGQELRIVVEEGLSYRAYQGLRKHLLERGGATSVLPAAFDGGRVELRVEARLAPPELMERLVAPPPEGLRVEPVSVDDRSLRIRVTELPPAVGD
jgi:hypothetical protein